MVLGTYRLMGYLWNSTEEALRFSHSTADRQDAMLPTTTMGHPWFTRLSMKVCRPLVPTCKQKHGGRRYRDKHWDTQMSPGRGRKCDKADATLYMYTNTNNNTGKQGKQALTFSGSSMSTTEKGSSASASGTTLPGFSGKRCSRPAVSGRETVPGFFCTEMDKRTNRT